jgi:hypothetical protein
MSSPTSRRSQRNSATPRRSSRASQAPTSSPAGDQLRSEASQASQSSHRSQRGTPKGKLASSNPPSSSPLFFGRSQKGTPTASIHRHDVSSPLRQEANASDLERTPRATRDQARGGRRRFVHAVFNGLMVFFRVLPYPLRPQFPSRPQLRPTSRATFEQQCSLCPIDSF